MYQPTMEIRIDKNSRVPIYDQIKEQIKGLIHAGQSKTGDQLPTIRELSVELAVNFNTVAMAYRDLVYEGVINTPGEAEMHTIRKEKLFNLLLALFRETDRLGYTHEEVDKAFTDQINKQSE
jgi:GntR family transcriptional regulator